MADHSRDRENLKGPPRPAGAGAGPLDANEGALETPFRVTRDRPAGPLLLLAIAISLLDRLWLSSPGRRIAFVTLVAALSIVAGVSATRVAGLGNRTDGAPTATAFVDGVVAAPAPSSPTAVEPVTPRPALTATSSEAATPTRAALATPRASPSSSPAGFVPVAQRGFVPILSYHHVRDWEAADREQDRPYIMPVARFEAQLRYLRDHGYQSVSTAQVYDYYANGKPLPPKPIVLSFDDSYASQYTNAVPLLKKYGFSATFFIMTVPLNKDGFMSSAQLQELDRAGFDIQAHTWDHQNVTKLKTAAEWQRQLVEPKKTLETMLGHPVPFFAYPFGAYDAASATHVKAAGYLAAFALSDVLDATTAPLFAIKRFIANSYWTEAQFVRVITTGVN